MFLDERRVKVRDKIRDPCVVTCCVYRDGRTSTIRSPPCIPCLFVHPSRYCYCFVNALPLDLPLQNLGPESFLWRRLDCTLESWEVLFFLGPRYCRLPSRKVRFPCRTRFHDSTLMYTTKPYFSISVTTVDMTILYYKVSTRVVYHRTSRTTPETLNKTSVIPRYLPTLLFLDTSHPKFDKCAVDSYTLLPTPPPYSYFRFAPAHITECGR